MNATTKPKVTKVSIVLLAAAVIYCLFTIVLFYSDFLTFPPIFESIADKKYALGFFYIPLASAVLALGALVFKFRAGSRKLSQRLAQFGLLVSGGLIAWWLAFESGFLPTILLPAFFLLVVIDDFKENKQSSM